jgi:signal peptide peptidase SppA
MQIQGQYAVIPMKGIISRHLPWWVVEYYGWVDQVQVEAALDLVLGDDSVKTVIFEMNSPGGMATGTPELAAKIREVSASGRRTIAWVDYLAASGCYWTAGACDAIYAIPSARIGSIGAVMAFADVSAYWEKEGIRLEAFASAEGKMRGMGGRATTESDRAYFQASVDRWGEWFRESVRARRGDLPKASWSGDTWDGREALAMGLIDGLATSLAGALVLDSQRAG